MAFIPLVRISRDKIDEVVVPSPAKMLVEPVDFFNSFEPIS